MRYFYRPLFWATACLVIIIVRVACKQWITNPSPSNKSCQDVCSEAFLNGVSSGNLSLSGQTTEFWVCASDIQNKGFHPGTTHHGIPQCYIAWHDIVSNAHPAEFKCLCSEADDGLSWVDSTSGQSCFHACADLGFCPASSGFYQTPAQPLYICSTDAEFYGYRVGWQVPAFANSDSLVALSSYSVRSTEAYGKRCLCQRGVSAAKSFKKRFKGACQKVAVQPVREYKDQPGNCGIECETRCLTDCMASDGCTAVSYNFQNSTCSIYGCVTRQTDEEVFLQASCEDIATWYLLE